MDNNSVDYIKVSNTSDKSGYENVTNPMQVGQQQNQIDQALQPSPEPNAGTSPTPDQILIVKNKPPYSFGWTIILALLFGLWGGYFIVWQNLIRIGRKDVAKKFLVLAGIGLFIVYLLIANYYRDTGTMVSSTLAGIIFPVWFNNKYGRAWNNENPGLAKFQWSLIGWGALGLPATMIFAMIVAVIFGIG